MIQKQIARKLKRFIWLNLLTNILLIFGASALLWVLLAWAESIIFFEISVRRVLFIIFSVGFLIFLTLSLIYTVHLLRKVNDSDGSLETLKRMQRRGIFTPDIFFSYFQLQSMLESDLAMAAKIQKEEVIHQANILESIYLPLKKFIPIAFYILTGVSLFLFVPAVNKLTSSSSRLLHFNTPYSNIQTLNIEILNPDLLVKNGEAFQLLVRMNMDFHTDYLLLNYGDQVIRMQAHGQKDVFSAVFVPESNLPEFRISYPGYVSESFTLSFVLSAEITGIYITVRPPKYSGLEEEHFSNARDLSVAEGSDINLKIEHNNICKLRFSAKNQCKMTSVSGSLTIDLKAIKDDIVLIFPEHTGFGLDTLKIPIFINHDLYPSISVLESGPDSEALYSYSIQASDDYGMNSFWIEFYYPSEKIVQKVPLSFSGNPFYELYTLSPDFMKDLPYSFSFCIRDNCAFQTHVTKSQVFRNPYHNFFELAPLISRNDSLFSSLKHQSDEFKKQIDQIQQSATNSQNSEWSKKEDISRAQEMYKEMLQELSKMLQDGLKLLKEDLSKPPDKPEREVLRDLLDDIMKMKPENPVELKTTKELLDFLKKMLEKNEQVKMDMKMAESLLTKSLNDQLKEAMLKKVEDLKVKNDSLLAPGKNVENEVLKKLAEGAEDLEKSSEELQKSDNLKNLSEEVKQKSREIKDNYKRAEGSEQKQKKEKISENSDKLSQMMDMLSENQDENEKTISEEQLKKHIADIVDLSQSAGSLVNPFRSAVSKNNALDRYTSLREISAGFNKLSDSIDAMFMSEPMVLFYVKRKSQQIKDVLKDLTTDGNRGVTVQSAVYPMNELSLILMDILEQLQQSSNSNSMTGGSCKKKSKPSSSSQGKKISEQQQKMSEKMKEGKQGEKQTGNKELYQLMTQQAAIRQALQAMLQAMEGEEGTKPLNKLGDEIAREMAELEKNILSKKKENAKLLEQSRRIETRLLDFEKAVKQKEELSEERISREGKSQKSSNKISNNLYNDKNGSKFDAEQLQKKMIRLKPFYSTKLIVN